MPSILRVIAGRTQQRRVVEKKKGETIDVPEGSASQGLLITGCEDCVINAPGRLSCVTVERCNGGMRINLGNVVASLEVIYCTDVQFSVARCRTITVDLSTNIDVSYKRQPPCEQEEHDEQLQQAEEKPNVHASDMSEEAAEVRLFTSSSEGVSLNFEDLPLSPSPQLASNGDEKPASAAAATAADASAGTYHVPKDWRYAKGDGPRSVSRVTVDSTGSGGTCKTLRCDQYGIPLEQVEAAEEGVPWTWEDGRNEDVGATFDRLKTHYTKKAETQSG